MSGSTSDARVDEELVEAVQKRREELGAAAPRMALFIFDCPDTELLQQLLDRIPPSVGEWFDEIVVMQERSASRTRPVPRDLLGSPPDNLQVQRLPRDAGYGGARKAAFEYACSKVSTTS